jgi:hypothetical protein
LRFDQEGVSVAFLAGLLAARHDRGEAS